MSTNILKKLVEQFAPETVRKQIRQIDEAAAVEREARFKRLCHEKHLLERLDGWPMSKQFATSSVEAIACLA
jgi:hypothetical protein